MKRTLVLALAGAAVTVSFALVWSAVHQEREFRRLIVVGDASLARHQTFVAVEAFSGALALKPDSMLAHLKRGDAYRRRGEPAAALRDLRDASMLDPTATRPLELLGDVNMTMGRYRRAADHYRKFASLDDQAPRVLYKLGLACYRNGQAGVAIEPLRTATRIDERFVEAHSLLGVCLRARGRNDEAVRAFRRAIAIDPAFTSAREELAALYTSLGRSRDAIEQLEALAAIEPARAERLVSVGLAYARAGRIESAIVTLGRAAERHPGEPTVDTALGRVWLEAAELRNDPAALRKALEALQRVVNGPAPSSEPLALYGRAVFLRGDTETATRILRQATITLPVEPVGFLYLSAAAERRGDLLTARDALIDYVGLLSDDEQVQTLSAQIADLSLRMDDAATALRWARRALASDATDTFVLGLLADAEQRNGQVDAARETLAQALHRDPGNRTLLRLQRRFNLRPLPLPVRRRVEDVS
jgi:tetratricopeptide (TPR) repeat protein